MLHLNFFSFLQRKQSNKIVIVYNFLIVNFYTASRTMSFKKVGQIFIQNTQDKKKKAQNEV